MELRYLKAGRFMVSQASYLICEDGRVTNRRVAVVGMFLESNAFARPVPERSFRGALYLEGSELDDDARAEHPRVMGEVVGFYSRMDQLGDWEAVPILYTMSGGGAAEHDFFQATVDRTKAGLAAAGSLDGVYICNHGAMVTTQEEDGDGVFFAAVRQAVGPDVPIAVTLDPHGNVSDLMVDSVDIAVAYRTDPHVDQLERGEEAADLLHEVWQGMKPSRASVRLPIVPPNVSLFTDEGPFAELVIAGQRGMTDDIANVSILGGFAFSDTSKNGLTIIVTGRNGDASARKLAKDLADTAWENRERFVCEPTSMDDAVERAVAAGQDAGLPPMVFSDLGDNCGAGGPVNTLWMLEGLHQAKATGVLIVNFRDRRLVEAAQAAGIGNQLEAVFTGDDWDRNGDTTYRANARVLALHDGHLVGRRGIVAGKSLYAGSMALIELDGIQVVVTTRAAVGNDPIYSEALGVDLGAMRTIVVKVRSSFPPAYDEFVSRENMLFVDTPGRTSPMLSRMPFERLPRPVYPLDRDFSWVNPLVDS